jgi:hypothetical protein
MRQPGPFGIQIRVLPDGIMMVLCILGNDGCPMTSGPSCCPSCSSGTLSWSPRRRRSRPHIDDLTWRKERGARRAAADIAIAVLFGLYECRADTDEDMLLVRMGLPDAADDLARAAYRKIKSLHLSLPSLADECPEWEWYQESWNRY